MNRFGENGKAYVLTTAFSFRRNGETEGREGAKAGTRSRSSN